MAANSKNAAQVTVINYEVYPEVTVSALDLLMLEDELPEELLEPFPLPKSASPAVASAAN